MKNLLMTFCTCFLFALSGVLSADTATFLQEHQYEARVVRGFHMPVFYGAPVDSIYMYAYDEASQTMHMIPFQIDERVTAPDPFNPNVDRASYFLPDNGVLDSEDELVFMIKDLGPKAPDHIWIDNEEAMSRQRVEIKLYDPNDFEKAAYGYLFYSSTITEPVPSPYHFQFDEQNDVLSNVNYSLRFGHPGGVIEDIVLNPPLGSGVDIFDTMKLRVVGVMDLGLINIAPGKNGNEALNERDNFYVYPFGNDPENNEYLGITKKPVVRMIREVRQSIKVGDFIIEDLGFYVQSFFYPFSGVNKQGANLNPDSLRKQFPDADDIFMQFDLVRQSWDFNENAVGMKFYNRNNAGVTMDGAPDDVNRELDGSTGISEWTMASGDQGTVFTHLMIPDTTQDKIELYYHDDMNGGQDDDSYIESGDTGDGKSYGDQGVKIINTANVEIRFIAYFLGKNKDLALAQQLAYNDENVPAIAKKAISFPTAVKEKQEKMLATFALQQNYPNPFNSSTRIAFSLPTPQHVVLKIVDLQGRSIKTLVDGVLDAGVHSVRWNGVDFHGEDAPSGVYLYQLVSEDARQTRKLLLVK